MKIQHTPIASAVALALMSMVVAAQAQQAAPAPAGAASAAAKGDEVQTVVVTGIRASMEQSINRKRNSDSLVEVLTAEDVGKMPDKNVADSLQRIPGVTISSAGASEGGFDENERVSLRGTNPSLTLTLINGHSISSGDWFVLNQVGTVGRSVSYSLLPSELVNTVYVRKASQADLVEGGIAGTVDILTNRPLSFKDQLTLRASAGEVYSDLPKKYDPQFNGLINWKNAANNVGVLFQAFYEKRHLRRDGQETLGYGTIDPNSALVTGRAADPANNVAALTPHPDLAGVMYPNDVGSALFEQVRERQGGVLDFQIKPSDRVTLDFSGFYSHMKATNYNRNWLLWNAHVINGGNAIQDPTSYTVKNGTLVSATFAPTLKADGTPNQYAIVDNIYRPGANATTKFFDFDGKFQVSDKLTLLSKVGQSQGTGETPKQDVFEGDVLGTGSSYTMHGIGSPISASVLAGNPAVFTGTGLDWIFGASPARTNDKETYGQIDGEYALDAGVVSSVKAGARFATHKRESVWIAQGPNDYAAANANPPAWNGETYPSDFASTLGGGPLTGVWQISPAALETWGDKFSNRDPVSREYFPGEFSLKENISSAYAMANLEGQGWRGNVGLRLVRTEENVNVNVAIPGDVCAALDPACTVPGAITTSAFGSFYRKLVKNTYNDPLPSANLTFDLNSKTQLKLGVAKTMTRPDFSALGGAVSLDDLNHTGSGGNANLKPIRSTNYNANVEWYFAPRALLEGGVFFMDLTNYVSYGTQAMQFRNIRTGVDETYNVTMPINSSGKVKGFELSWSQPLGMGFGAFANYTYADAKEKGGGPLVGASKNTYNLTGFFENDKFNVRVAYTFRSKFYNGLDRSSAQFQDDTASLAASLGYKITDNLTLSLDALNLNNPKLKYYANNPDQPTAFYVNGRQYYLTLRAAL